MQKQKSTNDFNQTESLFIDEAKANTVSNSDLTQKQLPEGYRSITIINNQMDHKKLPAKKFQSKF